METIPETGRRPIPPRRIRKPCLTWRGKELPLVEAGIPGFEVGHHGTIP